MGKSELLEAVGPIPEPIASGWGAGLLVYPLSGGAYDALSAAVRDGQHERIRALVLIDCLRDESGGRVFDAGDAEALADLPGAVTEPAFSLALRLSAIGADDPVGAAAADFHEARRPGGGSDSPGT